MTRYLLDTGPLAAYLLGRAEVLPLVTTWIRKEQAATSIIVYGEVTEYLKGFSSYPLHYQQLLSILQAIVPYFLTYAILETLR